MQAATDPQPPDTSDLDIMLSVPWNTSDLDTMLAFDHQIHGVEHAIEIFARKVKQHWRLHSESHPFTGNFVYNKMHNSVKHCRSAQVEIGYGIHTNRGHL